MGESKGKFYNYLSLWSGGVFVYASIRIGLLRILPSFIYVDVGATIESQ